MIRKLLPALFALAVVAQSAQAADLVRIVRYKLSAGDLPSGISAVEEYKRTTGVDAEYLDAVGWLARGAEMLHRNALAKEYVAELRREIHAETPELLVPLGAAIEVQGKLLAAEQGRGAAVRFLKDELTQAKAVSLRSRISKNILLLTLEGQGPPGFPETGWLPMTNPPSQAWRDGHPVLLFFWAQGCGDCKAQSAPLIRVWQKYKPAGLRMIAATRLYGTIDDKAATPEEETAHIAKVWSELYAGLDGVPVLVDTETMVHFGVSATPTFVLIDRRGSVRLYTPTRLSESELSKRIDELMAEPE
jgi:thiol-disulfide isomerase/thioredoxin